MSLDLFDLSFGHCLTNRCSLLDRIPYSTCPSHRFILSSSELRKKGPSTAPFHEYSLGGVLKRGQSAVDVPFRPVTSGGTVFCSLVLYPSPVFPEFLGTTEEGSKCDTFPGYSLGGGSTLLNTACRPFSLACVR